MGQAVWHVSAMRWWLDAVLFGDGIYLRPCAWTVGQVEILHQAGIDKLESDVLFCDILWSQKLLYPYSWEDLMRKYEDETAVLDLIARKTADGLWQSNPDFANVEDPPVQYMYIYFKILWFGKLLWLVWIFVSTNVARTREPTGVGIPMKRWTGTPGPTVLPPAVWAIWMAALQPGWCGIPS